ncbi:hypothetical protein CANARDRAFT_26926 [[Candida] arabinofermentans NRRL YB-2248]|uniref:Uncharacterized protein n=1 Tax=[Candida] arabinofermentans NRRL YB-2248 TaxID=983967 RepID=A0A1E4T6Z0_9ASCO|nr:hypothetical protein CANARDRAFT_26926 [[Candida] arabinofermentans NRRL YB-2248]
MLPNNSERSVLNLYNYLLDVFSGGLHDVKHYQLPFKHYQIYTTNKKNLPKLAGTDNSCSLKGTSLNKLNGNSMSTQI